MQLLIVRHADAGDAEEFAKTGQPDSLRPLSPKGRKQMRTAARALRDLVLRADVIVTSPLTPLEPEKTPEEFLQWMIAYKEVEAAIAVGHEPHLSVLVTWLMTGSADSRVELKKGGACLIEFDGRPVKGEGVLRWLFTPKHLKALAGA
jgi:phosphohistidine phosphatase